MTDNDLQRAVVEALVRSPLVHADEISVQVVDRNVFLRGTVGSFLQSDQAASAAAGVAGVRNIDNELRVRLMGIDGRRDADTQATVIDALAAEHLSEEADIDVEVRDRTVTLRGSVLLEFERDAVERAALAVPGVARVVNRLDVLLVLAPDDVLLRVHDAIIGLDRISVQIVDNDVTLTGTVSSPQHRDAALRAAGATPGVGNVYDEMTVRSAAA